MDNEIKKKLMSIWIVVILCVSSLFLLPNLYFSNAPIEYHTITSDGSISKITLPYSIYPSQSFDVTVGNFNSDTNFSYIHLSIGITPTNPEYRTYVYFNATKEVIESDNGTVQVILHCSLSNMRRDDLPNKMDYIDYGTNELFIFLNTEPWDTFFSTETVEFEVNSEEAARMWINYAIIFVLATGIASSLIFYRKSPSQPKRNDQ